MSDPNKKEPRTENINFRATKSFKSKVHDIQCIKGKATSWNGKEGLYIESQGDIMEIALDHYHELRIKEEKKEVDQ